MKTFKYIALATLTLGFAACTQDDDFAPQQEDIVQIASANIATEVQTRVNTLGDGKTFENDDQILLVNNSRTSKNSGTYTYNGTAWSLTSGMVLYASGTNDFNAYYPASVDFTLPTDQSDEAKIKSADRMVATATGVAKGAAVALNFVRQNAMVTITPSFNTEFGDDATISSLQIAGITPYHPTDAEDYKAIIEPSTTGFTVTLTVGEQSLTATTSTVIEAGKRYSFNLTVGKTAVGIQSVSVTDWSEKTISSVESEELIPNPIDATTMSTNALNTAVAEELARGIRNLEVTLAPDASAEMITAIRRALIDTEGVVDGSINLTLKGVTTIPDHHEFEGEGSSIFGQVQKKDDTIEEVTQLASVNLPDVLTIGDVAFLYCGNLTTVTAPKVQTIGMKAFYDSVLTSVNLPEATAIDASAFAYGRDIREFNLPKVTVLGEYALDIANPNGEVTMYLTSADEIVVHKNCFQGLEVLGNLDTKVNLVLNGNKQSQVNENTWTTKDADGNEVSFTFKSITFTE